MSEVIKKFEEGPEEGNANAKVVAQFDDTIEGENGNLKTVGRESNMPKEGHKAKVVKEFADTVDEGKYLRAESAPGK